MSLLEVLRIRGFDVNKKVKLVRHKDSGYDLDLLYNQNMLEFYQSVQSSNVFGNCEYIISFMGEEGNRARFIGIYQIVGVERASDAKVPKNFPYPEMIAPDDYFYSFEKSDYLSDLADRLVVDWGKSVLSWHQWLNSEKSKEIIEILPPGYGKPFPGYEDICMSFKELQNLIKYPATNKKWKEMLSAVFGIYLIVDTFDGKQYVGSAYGNRNGIWGRWEQYANNKHGGNKKLVELLEIEPQRYHYFQFSILRTLSKTLSPKEVIEFEQRYKKILGSRAFGLNTN